jgi:putative hydrolase of the HAD superfamily
MSLTKITTLFLDIGGVLLTNGWDRVARKLAAGKFGLDMSEMDERHHLTFDTYEAGKLTLDEYLARVVFYEERSFSPGQFREFMFAQSKPYPEMISLMRGLKARHGLRVAAVNNEGRELSIHRIKTFNLGTFIDCFVTSSFVHFRKPDADIYRMALDVVQAAPPEVLYIDDRAMFVDVARGLGINGIHHIDLQTTKKQMESFGLNNDEDWSGR